MAVAVQTIVSDAEQVAAAVLEVHTTRGDRAIEAATSDVAGLSPPVGRGGIHPIVIADRHTVEFVIDREVDPGELTGAIWRLAGRGWRILVLVASNQLGEAHRSLRGTPCHLQQWWFEGDGIRFGGLEIP